MYDLLTWRLVLASNMIVPPPLPSPFNDFKVAIFQVKQNKHLSFVFGIRGVLMPDCRSTFYSRHVWAVGRR